MYMDNLTEIIEARLVMTSDILTLQRAAKILDCNERILSERLKSGEIRAYKQARRWYILHEDLIAWVKRGEPNTTNARTTTARKPKGV